MVLFLRTGKECPSYIPAYVRKAHELRRGEGSLR